MSTLQVMIGGGTGGVYPDHLNPCQAPHRAHSNKLQRPECGGHWHGWEKLVFSHAPRPELAQQKAKLARVQKSAGKAKLQRSRTAPQDQQERHPQGPRFGCSCASLRSKSLSPTRWLFSRSSLAPNLPKGSGTVSVGTWYAAVGIPHQSSGY